jgi:hypothetical protein
MLGNARSVAEWGSGDQHGFEKGDLSTAIHPILLQFGDAEKVYSWEGRVQTRQ